MTTFATRRISQETFDAVVRENVEDFDMDAAEAVREAREQFEHQGVDLTGVDVSGSEERKAERAALVADVALVKKAAAGGVARPDLLEALARAATPGRGRGRAAASARSTVVAAQGSALARLARSRADEATDAAGDAACSRRRSRRWTARFGRRRRGTRSNTAAASKRRSRRSRPA